MGFFGGLNHQRMRWFICIMGICYFQLFLLALASAESPLPHALAQEALILAASLFSTTACPQ